MYRHDQYDQTLIRERVAQFRDQTRRYLAGELSDDEFRPLRLQNGLYFERHGPMLRIAIPYGVLSAGQLRRLAHVARTYDRGVGHFTTRQNLQLNWVRVHQVPDILAELAEVRLHAIQTSGNCVRNITIDPLAGVARDEIADPRPWAEILRQWSTLHPEFAYLPRKFKIAISGGAEDRAAVRGHDIGLRVVRDAAGESGFEVFVGGGLGRTPQVGERLVPFLPWPHLLTCVEAILRIYNRYGRRDNLHKARLKILVRSLGLEEFRRQVEAEWVHLKDGPQTLTAAEVARVSAHFAPPAYDILAAADADLVRQARADRAFAAWLRRNVHAHKVTGYAAVVLPLKRAGVAPGDCSADEMELVAGLAERYGFGELRVSHEQNLILPDVRQRDLYALWRELQPAGLATPNHGLITDLIACPGYDFCELASARSIAVAEAIRQRFQHLDDQHDIGPLNLNISGCVNACGHHHLGHIGILGLTKHGAEWYQITVGGDQGNGLRLGEVLGPALPAARVADAVERLIETYLDHRIEGERFVDTVHRIGLEPFRRRVYQRQVSLRIAINA